MSAVNVCSDRDAACAEVPLLHRCAACPEGVDKVAARSNVESVQFDIEQLAGLVQDSPYVDSRLTKAQIANVLEIALKTKVAVFSMGVTRVELDLGEGRVLECCVRRGG